MAEMKLHEAIRLGAMLKPQGREAFMHNGGTCALGAAMDACGLLWLEPLTERMQRAANEWPVLDAMAKHPEMADYKAWPLRSVIVDLNDLFKWTREEIADYVQTIEEAQATQIENADQLSMEPALALPSAAQK